MKAVNYRYLEFISSFDDHSGGNRNLTKVTSPVVENERFYRGLNFFSEQDLKVLGAISRGEYMTFGMCGKDIRQHLGNISSSAMSRIFKRLRLHGIIEHIQIFRYGLRQRSHCRRINYQKPCSYTSIGIGVFLIQKFCHFALKIVDKWPK